MCQVLAEEFAAEHSHVADNVVVKRFEKREKDVTIQIAWSGVMCWMRVDLESMQRVSGRDFKSGSEARGLSRFSIG